MKTLMIAAALLAGLTYSVFGAAGAPNDTTTPSTSACCDMPCCADGGSCDMPCCGEGGCCEAGTSCDECSAGCCAEGGACDMAEAMDCEVGAGCELTPPAGCEADAVAGCAMGGAPADCH